MTRSLLQRAPLACLLAAGAAYGQDAQKRLNVAFVVWDGVELIELTGPAQIISSADRFDEYTVAEAIRPLRSRFITIVPQYTFENCPKPDVVVVPGGRGGLSPAAEQRIVSWLRAVEPGAQVIMAVCNGVALLASSGLLDGHEATGPDGHLDEAMILGNNITPVAPARYHRSGKLITTQSYFAAVDAALQVVKDLRGDAEVQRVAEWNRHDWLAAERVASSAEQRPAFVTGRYLVFQTLKHDGMDAALRRFQNLSSGSEVVQGAPSALNVPEPQHFDWLLGSLVQASRHADAQQLGRFMRAAFPDSMKARVGLANALASGGQTAEALDELVPAMQTDVEAPRLRAALAAILRRPDCAPSDPARRARQFLQEHPFEERADLASADEPGTPLVVGGAVRDEQERPVPGALLYVFQADTEGRYTTARTMDESNARLFAYIRTGADGRYEFRTVRPGGYPVPADRQEIEWQIPAHIHFRVSAPGFENRQFQLLFDDDPRMQSDFWREWAQRDGHPVAAAERYAYGTQRCECKIVLKNRPGS